MYRWKKSRIYLAAAIAGLLTGMMLIRAQKESMFSGIFGKYFLNQYAAAQIDYMQMLRYIAGYRIGQYMLLLGAGVIPAAPLWIGGLLFLLGLLWGSMLSISAVQLGIWGIVICVAGLVPQIFFYLPAFGWIVLWVICGGQNRRKYLLFGIAGAFFLVFGILTEACVNPAILRQILGKIV